MAKKAIKANMFEKGTDICNRRIVSFIYWGKGVHGAYSSDTWDASVKFSRHLLHHLDHTYI